MEYILNFRPLAEGLYTKDQKKIKRGMIFRSGAPDRASLNDIQDLHSLGITKIYDLRRDIERTKLNPNIDITCMSYEREQEAAKPFSKTLLEGIAKHGAEDFMHALYQDYLPFSPLVKSVMKDILREEHPFLIHCAAGKDRTGAISAIIMMILGFDEKAIEEEYIQIDEKIVDYAVESLKGQGYTEEQIEQLMPIHTVKDMYMKYFMKGIYQRYDSIEHYLGDVFDLSEENIKDFRSKFLDS
jgi:protein-tyrosine phosphatase